jgi:hypothetical protein
VRSSKRDILRRPQKTRKRRFGNTFAGSMRAVDTNVLVRLLVRDARSITTLRRTRETPSQCALGFGCAIGVERRVASPVALNVEHQALIVGKKIVRNQAPGFADGMRMAVVVDER